MLKDYKKCTYCNSKNLIIQKNQSYINNFYLKSIISDFKLSKKLLKKSKYTSVKIVLLFKIILGLQKKIHERSILAFMDNTIVIGQIF